MDARVKRALLACLLLAACTDDGDASSTTTAAEVDERGLAADMADAADETEAVFLTAFDTVSGAGTTPQGAVLDLAGCEDRGREKVPHAYGRLDLVDASGSTSDDAEAARDLLVDEGFTPAESSRYSDGIDAADDRWTVAVSDGDVDVRVLMYQDRPYVIVDAVGRCLPVTEEERVRYNGLGPWDLDVTS